MNKEISYAKSIGLQEIDWRYIISEISTWKRNAADNVRYYAWEIKRHTLSAQNWLTCPTAQLSEKIPRESNGVPIDSYLYQLGYTFWVLIEEGNYLWASRLLDRLQEYEEKFLAESC